MAISERAWRRIACTLVVAALATSRSTVATGAGVLPISPGSWTLAILPDTQGYTWQTPQVFDVQTQFLRDNAAALNLKYVLHEGDITEHNNVTEWDRALTSMNKLNGVVPYAMVTGNHDVGPNGSAANRISLFDDPAYFGPGSYYASQPSIGGFFQPARTSNSWHTFNAGNQNWLILNLEWAPSNEAVAWANQVLDAHPTERVMILTHAYMYSDNTRYDWATYGTGQYANPHAIYPYWLQPPDSIVNDGEELWNKLVRTHNNVDFVFSGHVLSPGTGYRSDLSDGGHVVHQILANYQDNPSLGYMRLMEFQPDGTVQVRSYSPWSDQYNTNFDQQFTLQLNTLKGPNAPPPPPLIPHAVAANLIVSGPTNPSTNTVDTIQIAQSSTPGFSVRIANRGDYQLAVGGTPLQFYHGVLLASITQFDRPDFVGRHATVEVGRNSFGDGFETLSLMEAGNAAQNEVNFNTSVAWFQFQAGFRGAHVNANGGLATAAFNGVVQANVTHPSPGFGRYIVNLGVNSRTDGLLFTTGDNNSNIVVQTGPYADGTGWDVRVATNAQDFGANVNSNWSFLYLPYNTPGLIGGYYDGTNGTTISSVGSFTMNRLGTGQYELNIPTETPQTGMLILTVANLKTIGGVTAPDDNILAYQPSANGTFLINSYDMPGNSLEDTAFAWAFIDFTNGLTPAPGLPGDYDQNNIVNQNDYRLWRSQYGMVGTSLSADGNQDHRVDQADYVLWRKSLSASGNGSFLSGGAEVPEPSYTSLLVTVGSLMRSVRMRRPTFVRSARLGRLATDLPPVWPILALLSHGQKFFRDGMLDSRKRLCGDDGCGKELIC